MARRYYRRRRRKSTDDLFGTVLFVGVLAGAGLYSQLSSEAVGLIIGSCLIFAGLALLTLLFVQYKRAQHRRQKLRALSVIDANYMDGLAFEKYVVELLKNQGYAKVRLTERFDLGVDIIAHKDGVCWGVQVKRYSHMVKAEAVRQVVTALNKYNCQRAMVVTNNTYSRPARILAETNNCVLIGRDELAEWIIAFQEGK